MFIFSTTYALTQGVRNLVFEGAGICGIAYGGAIEVLEERGILESVEKVGGTSAGAITALMISLGYTAEEIKTIISETRFNKFNDGQFIFFGGLLRMKRKFGWYRGEAFEQWLERIIVKKTGNVNLTFNDLSRKGFKELHVVATCVNKQKLVVFSRETYPEMKVKDAVRISMSIPFYFEGVFIDEKGRVYKDNDPSKNLDIVADGGITGNFPIFLFDEINASDGTRIPNPYSLGFRIDTDEQILGDSLSIGLIPLPITSLSEYIGAFYTYVIESLNRSNLTPEDWDRTVSISSKGIGPVLKRLSQDQKDMLISSGQESAKRYLDNFSGQNSK